MIGTLVARVIFGLCAIAALAMGSGLAVPPHDELPGTPAHHDHVLGAYRFAFLIQSEVTTPALSPAMLALHRALERAGVPLDVITQMPGMVASTRSSNGVTIRSDSFSPAQDLSVEFALLVAFVPRLPRPTRRLIECLLAPALRLAQWKPTVLPMPPQSRTLRPALS